MEVSFRHMAKKYNIIFKRQNEEEMQSLVLAQHYTYKSAKLWSAILFILLVIIPTVANIILYFDINDTYVGVIAFFSIIILFFGEIVKNIIQSEKNKAAMIQQKFDLYVFNMNNISAIDENIIALQVEKYKKKNWNRKINWYQNYEEIDSTKVVFFCQKENVDWTENLSKKYKQFLIIMIVIVWISFVLNFILNNSSIIKMLSILVTSLPLLGFGLNIYSKIYRDEKDFDEIKNIVKGINDDINEISLNKLMNITYSLQILIYRHRQSRYLVPDWFEKRYHSHMQAVENRKTGQRLKQERNKKEK